jgi:hypothetical protein
MPTIKFIGGPLNGYRQDIGWRDLQEHRLMESLGGAHSLAFSRSERSRGIVRGASRIRHRRISLVHTAAIGTKPPAVRPAGLQLAESGGFLLRPTRFSPSKITPSEILTLATRKFTVLANTEAINPVEPVWPA